MTQSSKIDAAKNVLMGISQYVAGTTTSLGHGPIGEYCKKRGWSSLAQWCGDKAMRSGQESIVRGIQEWKDAD